MLLINRELAESENNAECTSPPKLTELVKKPSNLIKTGKKKPYCPISHFLSSFVEFVRRPCFYFAEGLAGLIDGLSMGRADSREGEVAVGFFE